MPDAASPGRRPDPPPQPPAAGEDILPLTCWIHDQVVVRITTASVKRVPRASSRYRGRRREACRQILLVGNSMKTQENLHAPTGEQVSLPRYARVVEPGPLSGRTVGSRNRPLEAGSYSPAGFLSVGLHLNTTASAAASGRTVVRVPSRRCRGRPPCRRVMATARRAPWIWTMLPGMAAAVATAGGGPRTSTHRPWPESPGRYRASRPPHNKTRIRQTSVSHWNQGLAMPRITGDRYGRGCPEMTAIPPGDPRPATPLDEFSVLVTRTSRCSRPTGSVLQQAVVGTTRPYDIMKP